MLISAHETSNVFGIGVGSVHSSLLRAGWPTAHLPARSALRQVVKGGL